MHNEEIIIAFKKIYTESEKKITKSKSQFAGSEKNLALENQKSVNPILSLHF